MIGAALRADPWTLPAFLALGALWTWCVYARGADVVVAPRWLTFVAGLAAMMFVSVTLTPADFAGSWHRNQWFDWHLHSFAGDGALSLQGQDGLNMLIGVPVGVAGALLAVRAHQARWVIGALVLPVVTELTQTLLPVLGRIGFAVSDVMLNDLGCVVGLGVGVLLAFAVFRTTPAPERFSGPGPRRPGISPRRPMS